MAFLGFVYKRHTFLTLLTMYYHHTNIYRALPVTLDDSLNLLIGRSYQLLDNKTLHRRSWNKRKMPQINYLFH